MEDRYLRLIDLQQMAEARPWHARLARRLQTRIKCMERAMPWLYGCWK